MIILILFVVGFIGLGGALNVYYQIKHMQERKELDAKAAQERATRKIFL